MNPTGSLNIAEPPERPKPQQEVAMYKTMSPAQSDNSQLESDESIFTRMFEGNTEDKGWRLLKMYFKYRRVQHYHLDTPAERIPCRPCLRGRLTYIRSSGESCQSCSVSSSAKCVHDLRGTLDYDRSWRDILPDELIGPATLPPSSMHGAQG